MRHFRHVSDTKQRARMRSALACLAVAVLGCAASGVRLSSPMPSAPRDHGTSIAAPSGTPVGDASATQPTQTSAGRALAGRVIAVDAGHGGYDGGARARDSGVWEKAINLQVAQRLESALAARGATVVMTRRTDVSLHTDAATPHARKRQDLAARLALAEAAGAEAFLSIHMNEYRQRSQSGPQVFYQRGADAGRLLAGALQQALLDGLEPPKRRAAMAGDYFVLRGKLPAALIECGFISNAQEEKLLLSAAYQQRLADCIADGVGAYFALRDAP